jgi:hypothetical protein
VPLSEKQVNVAFHVLPLDGTTRTFMLAELERDIGRGIIYLRPRAAGPGRIQWADLLRNAVRGGDEERLAESLLRRGLQCELERRRLSGKIVT